MSVIRIALLQYIAEEMNVSANLAKGIRLCRRAQETGADIALFPEMWSIGYSFPDESDDRSVKRWKESALDAESEFLTRFRDLASELSMAIAVTYLQKWEGSPQNAVSIIDRHGEIKLEYAKVHTCDFGAEALLTPGDSFPVASLDTRNGPVQVGAMICYDREFPESARMLMLAGGGVDPCSKCLRSGAKPHWTVEVAGVREHGCARDGQLPITKVQRSLDGGQTKRV